MVKCPLPKTLGLASRHGASWFSGRRPSSDQNGLISFKNSNATPTKAGSQEVRVLILFGLLLGDLNSKRFDGSGGPWRPPCSRAGSHKNLRFDSTTRESMRSHLHVRMKKAYAILLRKQRGNDLFEMIISVRYERGPLELYSNSAINWHFARVFHSMHCAERYIGRLPFTQKCHATVNRDFCYPFHHNPVF